MGKFKLALVMFISLIFVAMISLVWYAQQPREDNFNAISYLAADEGLQKLSLQNDEVVFGIINTDEISKYILTNIGEKLDLDFSFQYFDTLCELLDSISSGDVDFTNNISYSEERNTIFDFTVPSNIENIYLVSKNPNLINNMSGKTIGVPRDSIFADLILNNYNNVNLIYYDTIADFFEIIDNDAADGAIGTTLIFADSIRKGYHQTLLNDVTLTEDVSIITKKGTNETLLSLFNDYIMTNEYQTALQNFKDNYFREIYKTILDEKIAEYYPSHHIDLQIKLENNSPFSYYDKDGNQIGIFSDILTDICNLEGFNCEITSLPDETWDSMYNDLLNAKIDVLAPVTKTNARLQILNFSDPIITSDYVVLSRSNYENANYENMYQLLYEKIGTVEGDIKNDFLLNLFPNKDLIYFDNNLDLLKALSNREVDYILVNEDVYYQYVKDTKDYSLKINNAIGSVFSNDICFAFPNNVEGKHLAEIFSLAIKIVDAHAIINQYDQSFSLEQHIQDLQNNNILKMIIFSTIIVSLSFGILISIINKSKIKFKANHDYLTGLYNRRGIIRKLDNWVKSSHKFIILFMDLDKFKHYNDLKGYVFGDQLLCAISKNLQKIKYQEYLTARFGGDEFVLAFRIDNDNEVESCIKLAEDAFGIKIVINEFECNINVSIGSSVFPKDGQSIELLIGYAQTAMQEAKESETQKVVHYNQRIFQRKLYIAEMIETLKECIVNDGFEIFYQPIYDIETNTIVFYEALLRIKNSEISPAIFVPIAEKNGLMNKIGKIVIEKVIKQISIWKKNYQVATIDINFSETQLYDENIIAYLTNLLDKYSVEPNLICAEITERVYLDNEAILRSFLSSLKEIGFLTAIDDFGSGNAAVSFLTNFAVDYVKIDKSIVDKYLRDDQYLVFDTILKLCKYLGFKVVVEGIEEKDQIDLLKKLNVKYVQGYYYSRPIDAKHIEKTFKKLTEEK